MALVKEKQRLLNTWKGPKKCARRSRNGVSIRERLTK